MTKRELSRTEARQGETRGHLRYILVISTALAIIALIVVFLLTI